jgi:hypothetical protein
MTLLIFSDILCSKRDVERTQRPQDQSNFSAWFATLDFNDPFAAHANGFRQLVLPEIQLRSPIADQST